MLNIAVTIWIIAARFSSCFAACLDTFTILGPGIGGNDNYWSGTKTLKECQTLCNGDVSCLGFEYKASDSSCQLSSTNISESNGDGDSYFHRKNCCSDLYTSIGNKRRTSVYSIWESSPLTMKQCEDQCSVNAQCLGFYYNTGDNTCGLSSSASASYDHHCSSCHFYVRQCPGGCFNTYTSHGPNRKGEAVLLEETSKTIEECESLCNSNEICQGFHYETDDGFCQLTLSNIAVIVGIFSSYCEDCFFYQRHCPKGCLDTYTVDQYRTGNAVYMENTLTVGECEAECTKDSFCEGFAYRTDNSRCQLSTSNSGTPSFCSSCYFHKRQCSTGGGSGGVVTVAGGVVTTAVGVETTEGGVVTTEGGVVTTGGTSSTEMVTKIETTETPSSEIITSTQSTIEKTTNNWLTTPIEVISTSNSIQCSCVCIELNITLEESIERRKKELEINVDELSSTKRKLVSVDDPRPSAKTIGYLGLAFCVLLGAFIVIPDFFSVVFFIFRRIKNRSY